VIINKIKKIDVFPPTYPREKEIVTRVQKQINEGICQGCDIFCCA